MRNAIRLLCAVVLFLSCRDTTGVWYVRVTAGQGVFSLTSPSLSAKNIHTEVYAGDGQRIRLAGLRGLSATTSSFSDALGAGAMTTMAGTDVSGLTLRVTLRDYGKGFVVAEAAVGNASSRPFTVEGFSFGVDGSSSSCVPGADRAQAVLTNGYQSWSPAIVSEVVDSPVSDEALFENIENDGDVYLMDMRTSWWFSALYSPRASLVSGGLTSRKWKTKVLTYRRNEALVWRVITGRTWVQDRPARDRVTLAPGESAASEQVFIGLYQNGNDGLGEYTRTAAVMTPPLVPPFVPVGWNSWNTYFSTITEGTILDNARFISTNFSGHGFNNIQIDDGWENGWGDWMTNTTRFPSGMDGLAQSLTAMGFTPGIWMAPFLVDKSNPLITTKAGWFLTDDTGALIPYGNEYIIDATNPQAMNWVLGNIQRLLGWGYRYLKLDFLFAEAYEGQRYRPGTTSMEAYREAMTAILTEATNAGAYVLACGAPILPTAGAAHGIRTGGDIALSGFPYTWAFIKNESRNTAVRYFLNALFAGDPDTALLRDVSLEEARVNLTAALLSGKIFALGDALPGLAPEKAALIARIKDFPVFSRMWEPMRRPPFAGPVDLFAEPSPPSTSVVTLSASPTRYDVPEVWALRFSDTGAAAGLFNWSETARTIGVSLGQLGLRDGSYRAVELWSGKDLGPISSSLSVSQPPHSVSLILFEDSAPR